MVFKILLVTAVFVLKVTAGKNVVPDGLVVFKIANITAEIRDDLITTANEVQNCYRANHGADPLTLDSTISQVSQAWANRLAATDSFQHSGNNYGENLYAAAPTISSGGKPISAWYKEYIDCDYVFGSNNPSGCAGHFTQVVWKNSKRVGYGIAAGSSWTYFVANYDPPGNYGGQYANNVGSPINNVLDSCGSKNIDPVAEIQIL